MPAKSTKQRQLMAIAEHHPGEVYAKNKGVLKMSHEQLHDFAATKGLKKGSKVAHKGGHPADGHHKGHAPGGPGKTRDGHGSLMDAQRHAHDSFRADGPMKRHTFHNIQHKRHAEKLACG